MTSSDKRLRHILHHCALVSQEQDIFNLHFSLFWNCNAINQPCLYNMNTCFFLHSFFCLNKNIEYITVFRYLSPFAFKTHISLENSV